MSTIKVNTLDSTTGTSITVPTGKTFVVTDTGALTIGGTAITTGSSNILRKTADYTVVSGDVTAKSELVIATSAAASSRTITLPAVATSGLSTCIITIVADADATSTYKLMVEDSASAEIWTGYQTGDFVRLIVSNSAWVVLDHKETYYSHRYLTADNVLAASATTKITGFTNVTEIGNAWDNANHKLVSPFAGFWSVDWNLAVWDTTSDGAHSLVPVLYVGGAEKYKPSNGTDGVGYNAGTFSVTMRLKVAASTDVEFYAYNIQNTTYASDLRSGATRTQFTCKFTRTY